jgi:16S rRNA (cytosine967-C5)-methyltransferase
VELTAQRLNAATDALRAMLSFEHPADAVLRSFFREHRALGQRDRGLVAELAFAALRHLRLLETLAGGRHPRRLVLAAAALIEGRSLRQLEPVLRKDEAQWLAGVRAADAHGLPPAVQVSLPDWIWERLLAAMPEAEALAIAHGLLAPAPLDLRVNSQLAERKAVLAALQAEGMAAAPTPYSPLGVRLAEKPALQHHALFREGKVEVQDEASQLLGWLVAPRRREMVVDFCAGAGGKTLALGALMRSEGRLYAFDTAQHRLANLAPRLKRSGLSNVHPQLIDDERDVRVRRLAGKIDRVLVDAPCTGLGTLRRNRSQWRRRALADCAQAGAILAAAATLVNRWPAGVYHLQHPRRGERAWCRHSSPRIRSSARRYSARSGIAPKPAVLQVYPHTHRMDGFFAAVLGRAR